MVCFLVILEANLCFLFFTQNTRRKWIVAVD